MDIVESTIVLFNPLRLYGSYFFQIFKRRLRVVFAILYTGNSIGKDLFQFLWFVCQIRMNPLFRLHSFDEFLSHCCLLFIENGSQSEY